MRKITWKEENSVGIKALDRQHQEVISYLNTLFEFFEKESQPEVINELFLKLERYSEEHFATEEALFAKFKYQDKEAHIKEHDIYRNSMTKFRQQLDSDDPSVIENILEFLADWWMGHIQGCDKEYTRFLNNNGVF